MIRRNGNTTRLIDLAIQRLFIDGKIFIPDGRWIDKWRDDFSSSKEFRENQSLVFIDNLGYGRECIFGRSQEHFKRILLGRLKYEHNLSVDNTEKRATRHLVDKDDWLILKN